MCQTVYTRKATLVAHIHKKHGKQLTPEAMQEALALARAAEQSLHEAAAAAAEAAKSSGTGMLLPGPGLHGPSIPLPQGPASHQQ